MSWIASERFTVRKAPGGLALVQELLNTREVNGSADLLADRESAADWLSAAAHAWARERGGQTPADTADLREEDLPALRDLRATFTALLLPRTRAEAEAKAGTVGAVGNPAQDADPATGPGAEAGDKPADGRVAAAVPTEATALAQDSPARLVSDDHCEVRLLPVGTGAAWLRSAVWSEVLLAQLDGSWPRLKICRNAVCQSSFYDASRNNSGVWHDVRKCGNLANLRASRARKQQRVAAASGPVDGAEGTEG